ncbi:MAG: multicopper oxidase domain-containing protein [Kineosporiaceae bacterium]
MLLTLMSPATPAAAATVPIDLYAVTGTTTLGVQTVTVWGYNGSGAPATQPGGPTLIVDQGDTVQVTLHNGLSEATGLLFQGQDMTPDTSGVAAGGTRTYSFTAGRPGTYLYEAGLLPNAQHQVAMGLYGALIVRPAVATQAYGDPATAFDDEAVLVLSEIDPALNNRTTAATATVPAGPAGFDMRKYAPRYFLVNGKAYPNTDPIPTTAGNRVLLRYVNAGNQYHSMALHGAHQTVIALDGSPLSFSRRYVAETFGPGQTTDAIVTVPPSTAGGTRLAIHDGSLLLHNSNTAGSGGMLTFLTVTGPAAADTGPVTSNVAYSAGNLTATVADPVTGQSTIAAAEYFTDTVGAAGTGTAMNAADGSFSSVSEAVTLAVTVPAGQHVLYVRGRDSLDNWGVVSSVLVSGGDLVGPVTTSPSLTPGLTNGTGTASVAVHATGSDVGGGGSTIAAAEYFVDAVGANGSGTAMTISPAAAPTASLDAAIPAATVNALAEGSHVVSIRSQDSAGNWGAPVTVNLVVDKSGPNTSGVSAAPNPSNGVVPVNASTPAVRVTAATLSDPIAGGVRSNITAAEAFLCAAADTGVVPGCVPGGNGTGIPLAATDGVFNSPAESGYADIPLATILQLTNGTHTIYVHGRDAAGNWGATSLTGLVVDKIAPSVVSITRLDPDPTSAATVRFLITFSESVTGVATGNFTLAGSASGAAITSVTGTGATRTVTATTGSGGGGTLGLNLTSAAGISDAAGNALPTTGLPFVGQVYTQPSPPLYFSTVGNTNPPGVGGTADDADIYFWNGTTAFSRGIDVSAITNPLPAGANVDGFDRVSATQFYMSFSGAVTIALPGPDLTVQDEDVVLYNAGTWSLYFDGSVNGVGGTDLDAISIAGGQLYFSTDTTLVPPGSGGTGDDADIYRWNGGSSYTRVVDASALGWSTANVDGLVWIDATDVYLSYSADTTVPGVGAVQDEDVVRNNGGTWSVYFNGTARGLTAANQDIDAFDLP